MMGWLNLEVWLVSCDSFTPNERLEMELVGYCDTLSHYICYMMIRNTLVLDTNG
jgi:hypothetical protein